MKRIGSLMAMVLFAALVLPGNASAQTELAETEASALATLGDLAGDGGERRIAVGGPADSVGDVDFDIVGGTTTTISKYPFMVQLEYPDGDHLCTGSLVRTNIVITARHCLEDFDGDFDPQWRQFKVRYGTTGQKGGSVVGIENFWYADGSNQEFERDMVALILKSHVTLGANVKLVELATDAEIKAARTGLILGWGRYRNGGPSSNALREGIIPIFTDQRCEAVDPFGIFRGDRHICGGGVRVDSCQGDSGGPIMVRGDGNKWRQAGVTSFGPRDCRSGPPGTYTDVGPFRFLIANRGRGKCVGQTATVDIALGETATAGNDVIIGTPFANPINGLGGNDLICGGGGADVIRGGDGRDKILGQGGADVIFGDDGADVLIAGPGNDIVNGGGGPDLLLGLAGADLLIGGGASDRLNGGGGADTLNGGAGRDRCDGGPAVDIALNGTCEFTVRVEQQ